MGERGAALRGGVFLVIFVRKVAVGKDRCVFVGTVDRNKFWMKKKRKPSFFSYVRNVDGSACLCQVCLTLLCSHIFDCQSK